MRGLVIEVEQGVIAATKQSAVNALSQRTPSALIFASISADGESADVWFFKFVFVIMRELLPKGIPVIVGCKLGNVHPFARRVRLGCFDQAIWSVL